MDNQIYLKVVKKNQTINIDFEKIEGEGAVIVDEENDKIHFLNSTALIIYEQIVGDAVSNVYERYKDELIQKFTDVNQLDIKDSFEEVLVMLVEKQIVEFVE